jgi:hypothetical protein
VLLDAEEDADDVELALCAPVFPTSSLSCSAVFFGAVPAPSLTSAFVDVSVPLTTLSSGPLRIAVSSMDVSGRCTVGGSD